MSAEPTVDREWLRERLIEEMTKRMHAADIGRWSAPSGSTGLTVTGIAADVALEMMGYR